MVISEEVLNQLTQQAKDSSRLRMNLDLRNSPEDNSQRMLNALEPGTELPIHRHINTSEIIIILRGKLEQQFFDDNGNLIQSVIIEPNSENMGLSVPKGIWHKSVSLESGTVIFETKDGKYEPLSPEDIHKSSFTQPGERGKNERQ